MADDVVKVLERLSRKIGRRAAMYERWVEDGTFNETGKQRAFGEATTMRLAQSFVRDELTKAKAKKP